MLPKQTENEIVRLLAEGVAIREIARRLGVGRNQVRRIARGQRPDYERLRELARRRRERLRMRAAGPATRCLQCGARVRMPCVLCGVRRLIAAHGTLREPKAASPILRVGVGLIGPQRRRYEALRRRKQWERSVSGIGSGHVLRQGVNLMSWSSRLPYLRWLLAHLEDLEPLLELPQRLAEAETIADKWELVKWAGDRIVALLDDFPLLALAGEDSAAAAAAIQAEFEARGIPWDTVMQLLPWIIELIELLRGRRL